MKVVACFLLAYFNVEEKSGWVETAAFFVEKRDLSVAGDDAVHWKVRICQFVVLSLGQKRNSRDVSPLFRHLCHRPEFQASIARGTKLSR